MVRTQIQLDEDQVRKLREMAVTRHVSMAKLIRLAVDRILAETAEAEKLQRSLSIAGRFHSGLSDVSVEHDKYLAEDYR